MAIQEKLQWSVFVSPGSSFAMVCGWTVRISCYNVPNFRFEVNQGERHCDIQANLRIDRR
jgi:hypothetical protein